MESISKSLSELVNVIKSKYTTEQDITQKVRDLADIYENHSHIYARLSPKYSKELSNAIKNIKTTKSDRIDMIDYVLDCQNIVSFISKYS